MNHNSTFTFDVTPFHLEHFEMENLNHLLRRENGLKKVQKLFDENSNLLSLSLEANKTNLNEDEFENAIHSLISQILFNRQQIEEAYEKQAKEADEEYNEFYQQQLAEADGEAKDI